MPVLNDLARQYAKQSVVVLAINVEGSSSTYSKYLDEHGYDDLWAARDASGDIARQYKVRGIPATYIIDAEGTIRHVHLGYGSGMGDTMAQEIEALIP